MYLRRRELLKAAGLLGLGLASGVGGNAVLAAEGAAPGGAARKLSGVRKSAFSTSEKANTFKEVAGYNNYYEFGTEKTDPAEYAQKLKTRPWTVVIEGEVKKPRTVGIEDLLKLQLEERIYQIGRAHV